MELNHRPSGYEPDKLPLLYPAIRILIIEYGSNILRNGEIVKQVSDIFYKNYEI